MLASSARSSWLRRLIVAGALYEGDRVFAVIGGRPGWIEVAGRVLIAGVAAVDSHKLGSTVSVPGDGRSLLRSRRNLSLNPDGGDTPLAPRAPCEEADQGAVKLVIGFLG